MTPPSPRALRLVGLVSLVTLAMRYPPPHTLGHLVLEERSRAAGIPGVPFEHWRHRVRFTCRVCHVDVGFAMAVGQSGISASTNRRGFHCGACHDGKRTYRGDPIFSSCDDPRRFYAPGATCKRCHTKPVGQ